MINEVLRSYKLALIRIALSVTAIIFSFAMNIDFLVPHCVAFAFIILILIPLLVNGATYDDEFGELKETGVILCTLIFVFLTVSKAFGNVDGMYVAWAVMPLCAVPLLMEAVSNIMGGHVDVIRPLALIGIVMFCVTGYVVVAAFIAVIAQVVVLYLSESDTGAAQAVSTEA